MTGRAKIRTATLLDIYAVEALGRHALEESGRLYGGYNLSYVLKGIIDSIDRGLIYLAETEDQTIIGGLVISLTSWPQAPDQPLLTNEHLYVLPDHRSRTVDDGRLVGMALIDILQDMSNTAKVPVVFNTTFGTDMDVTDRLMKRAGFRTIGGSYLYQPKMEQSEEAA